MAHLFEFMDQPWLPGSLRLTLREILECGNAAPFRDYYRWAAQEVLRAARDGGYRRVVELGAGTAPLTRHLAAEAGARGLTLIPCDANPDRAAYRQLAEQYPETVSPLYEPVDFSQPRPWGRDTLLVLSATLHHIPSQERPQVLQTLTQQSGGVLLFEPLRKNAASMLFVLGSVVPALLLPLRYLHRPGRLRRLLYCWLLPVAPLMFCWDGWASCLRMWKQLDWRQLEQQGSKTQWRVAQSLVCQSAIATANPPRADSGEVATTDNAEQPGARRVLPSSLR